MPKLARQTTRVGSRRGKGGFRAKGKIPKKQMMKSRAPLVETKSKTREDLVNALYPGTLFDAMAFHGTKYQLYHMNPVTYMVHKQGFDEHEVIGRSIVAKFLKMKISIRFPQQGFTIDGIDKVVPLVPQRYELIWGWVPVPLMKTENTVPKVSETTIDEINKHIDDRVKDYLDERKDHLRYIPKQAATIRIVGRRRVKPNLNSSSTAPPTTIDSTVGADYAVGSIPMYHTSVSWKCHGRRLNLEKSIAQAGGAQGEIMVAQYTWAPFCVLNNIDYDTLPGEAGTPRMPYVPAIAFNDVLYFTDS